MFKLIAPALGPLLDLGVKWFVAKNTDQIVERKASQNVQLDRDKIRALIHTYHFGSTEARRAAALKELRAKGAMT